MCVFRHPSPLDLLLVPSPILHIAVHVANPGAAAVSLLLPPKQHQNGQYTIDLN